MRTHPPLPRRAPRAVPTALAPLLACVCLAMPAPSLTREPLPRCPEPRPGLQEAVSADFQRALESGDLSAIRRIVERSPELVGQKLETGGTAFGVAIDRHNRYMVELLLELGFVPPRTGTLLFEVRDPEIAELLVSAGADPNAAGSRYASPLERALEEDRQPLVEVLLENGAKIDFRSAIRLQDVDALRAALSEGPPMSPSKGQVFGGIRSFGPYLESSLFLAAEVGSVECGRVLVEHGVDPHARRSVMNAGLLSPLYDAVSNGNLEFGRYLSELGVSPIMSGGRNISSLLERAAMKESAEMVDLLIDMGADPEQSGRHGFGMRPVAQAVMNGRSEAAMVLLDRGAPLFAERDGAPLSFLAALEGHLELSRDLAELEGRRSLHLDSAQGALDRLEAQFMREPARADSGDEFWQWPPLAWATKNGQVETVRWLLEHGADPNQRFGRVQRIVGMGQNHPQSLGVLDPTDKDFMTALDLALNRRSLELVEVLLEFGALTEKSYVGPRGFLRAAVREDWLDLATRLLETVDITEDGQLLWWAAYLGQSGESVELLLEHGADPSLPFGQPQYPLSPLAIAHYRGHLDVAERLLEAKAPIDLVSGTLLGRPWSTFLRRLQQPDLELDEKTPYFQAPLANMAAARGHLWTTWILVASDFEFSWTRERWEDLIASACTGDNPLLLAWIEAQGDHPWSPQLYERAWARAAGGDALASMDWLASHAGRDVAELEGARGALRVAAEQGALRALRYLLHAGVDSDTAGFEGWTPLHLAAMAAQPDAVQILLEHGASLTVKDWFGRTAEEAAGLGPKNRRVYWLSSPSERAGRQACVELLASARASAAAAE